MSDVLIPFAIRKSTGEYVEVASVEKGKQCGCVCPSCRQGMIARHCKSKAWHFAHDPNADDKPVRDCDVSFFSCCRLFILELLSSGEISKFKTPDLLVTEVYDSFPPSELSDYATKSKQLEGLTFDTSGIYDAVAKIDNFRLHLFLEYRGRLQPDLPKEKKSGAISINIETIREQFLLKKGGAVVLSELISHLFEEDEGHKRWIYHPLEEKTRAELRHRIETEGDALFRDDYDDFMDVHSEQNIHSDSVVMSLPNIPAKVERYGDFTCVICNVTWQGKEFSSVRCPKCKKHFFSRFVPEYSTEESLR